MNSLDSKHIQLIEADVENARITINNLSQELVDHICCEVEELMHSGKGFDEAYAIIKEQTGIKVLQQIQENTLYLIDKKYKTMKTTMKITGNVSLAFIAIGTAFEIFHYPGAALLLMLGFFTLCFVFFPAAIYLNYTYKKDQKKPLLNLSILTGGIAFMIGVLFKLMHWPGAAMLLLLGWSLILGIFLPILLFVKLKEADSGKERSIYVLGVISLIIFEMATMFKMFHWPGASFLMLLGGVLLFAVFLPLFVSLKFKKGVITIPQFIFLTTLSMYAVVLTFLMALSVMDVVFDRFVRDEASTTRIVNYYKKRNVALNDSIHKVNAELRDHVNKIAKLILDTKVYLITNADGVDESTALKCIANPALIERKSNYDCTNSMFLPGNEISLVPSLKKELNAFKKKVLEASSGNPGLSKSIEKLLDTSDDQMGTGGTTWEELNFRNTMIVSALAQLTEMEKNVRLVASVVSVK